MTESKANYIKDSKSYRRNGFANLLSDPGNERKNRCGLNMVTRNLNWTSDLSWVHISEACYGRTCLCGVHHGFIYKSVKKQQGASDTFPFCD